MSVVVEYLLIVKQADTFCSSAEAFTALLNVDSSLHVDGGTARIGNNLTCDYAITSGEIRSKLQRYFHVRFSANNCATEEEIEAFSAFLRVVRSTMAKVGGQPETLWDDISYYYSKNAYRLIHRVENLMRKLIANFMLVTVGAEWVNETAPDQIKEAINKSKRKEYLNVLHSLDFIHLADLLLRPYSTTTDDELHNRLRKAETVEHLNDLKSLIPQSNWTRYFSALVDCNDDYLNKRWKNLYELRCKVAHNAIISKADYELVATLVGELEVKLEDAIKKLPQVEVPQAEIEKVAENAAFSISELLGDFITAWRLLEGRVIAKAREHGAQRMAFQRTIECLHKSGVVCRDQMERATRLYALRNHIIHSTGMDVSPDELRKAVRDILDLIEGMGGFRDPEALGYDQPQKRTKV